MSRPPLPRSGLTLRPLWERLSIWQASSRTVLVSLLAGMLLVVGVTGGSMLFFANLVVQRQVNRLPPELRDQFREHNDPQPGSDGAAASAASQPTFDQSTFNQSTSAPATDAAGSACPPLLVCTLPNSPVQTGGLSGPTGLPFVGPVMPAAQTPRKPFSQFNRARSFLRDVGTSLQLASLVSALFGLLLAVLLARRIARPISAVSEAAVRVAAGDLGARAPLLPGDRETTELARSFNVMAQGLQALEQERRDTVASIAHELRTPLTVMQARLDAIEDGIYPLDLEQMGQLSAQTQLLTRLVGDLRTLSLAEAGRLTIQPVQLLPLSLVRSVAEDIQAARAGSHIRVEVLGQESHLRADPDRLRQVLVNLVENAFKHAQSRIQLTVQAPVQGGQHASQHAGLALHIDDDGPGIPVQERERVFENFVRLETSRSRDSGGTGLGLAVVRALMLAHGGEIELGSSPLGGTRATLRFPSAAQAQASAD